MINNPIGIGVLVSLLVLGILIYWLWKYRSRLVEEQNIWIAVTILWLIFGFWGVNGMTFPVSIAKGAFRVWVLLAIPIAIAASEATFLLARLGKRWKIPSLVILIIIILGVLSTSGAAKYQLNSSIWPTSGSFVGANPREVWEYGAWFQSIPPDSKVFLYAPRDKVTIGFGGDACDWCQQVIDFRKEILHKDAKQLHAFLKRDGYRYLVLNARMDAKYLKSYFNEREVEVQLPLRYQDIINSGLFQPVLFNPDKQKENLFVVMEVK